jgi:hypothetical protein
MGCPDGSGRKTKSYKPVAQIACVSVSIVLVLNVHIPVYLGSRRKPFLQNLRFFLWGRKTPCALIATPNKDNANGRQKKGKS